MRGSDGHRLLGAELGAGAFIVGSGPAASVRLEGSRLSSNHLRLWVGEGGVKLERLEGQIRVEGRSVRGYVVLLPGQEADLGDGMRLEVRVPAQQEVTKYEVGELLAEGGTGPIHSAQELSTGRVVAFKMPTAGVLDEQRRRQFLHEARITAQLDHPGVVPVYEVGDGSDGMVYYTMKRIRGITLEKVLDLIAAGTSATITKYPLQNLVTVFLKVCETVAFAHSRGIVHRSLRPASVTLGDFGEVLVMGWGTATVQRSDVKVAYGLVEVPVPEEPLPDLDVGDSPQHLSPEQVQSGLQTVDALSDVYALGVILYQILSLRGPIEPGSLEEMRERVARGEVLPLKMGPGRKGVHLPGGRIPAALAAVVARAMRPVREDRYQSVAELKEDVERYIAGYQTSAEGGGAWRAAWLFVQRHRRGAAVVGIGLGVALVSLGQTILAGRRAEQALSDLRGAAGFLKDLAEMDAGVRRMEPALKKLERVLELAPWDAEALRRKAWVHVGQGKLREASVAMRIVLERLPSDSNARKALDVLERLEDRSPREWTVSERTLLGRLLMENQLYGEALALGDAVVLTPAQRLEVVRVRVGEWLGPNRDGQTRFEVSLNGGKEVELRLKEPALTRLEPLRALPVDVLDLRGTSVSDLGPLRGMRLTGLKIDSLDVSDLGPLSGMPLKELTMSWVPVESVEALRACPLETLDATASGVLDYLPLFGRPLKNVRLGYGSGRVDLRFLQASPVEVLTLDHAGVRDLGPLKGRPLKELDLTGNPVESLKVLEGMKLERLTLHSVDSLRGTAPLGTLSSLQELTFSWRVPRWLPDELRSSRTLKKVMWNGRVYPPDEFWAKWESLPAEAKADEDAANPGAVKEESKP